MSITEASAAAKVDYAIRTYPTGAIRYYPYASTSPTQGDLYRQGSRTYGTPVIVIGRAIHRPTKEQVTVIGDGEAYEVAFLFSRLELVAKFPAGVEGEWISPYGEVEWRNRRYKIEHVRPTAQFGEHFLMVCVLANSIPGHRDA